MKKIIAILLALLTLCAAAQAAGGSVLYVGGAEKFVFLPGSDLFDNFKGVMPGDVLTQKITVTNNSDYQVRIYVRAEGANEQDQAFLNRLHLNVKSGSSEIFDAQADEKAQLTKNTLLGTFKKKGKTELMVTLTVPTDLENEFMGVKGTIPWTFLVEEIDTSDTPKTGDWFDLLPWIGAFAAICGLAIWLIIYRRRQKEN